MEREEIIENFSQFIRENYYEKLLKAVSENAGFLLIDFSLLDKFSPELASYLLENPEETIWICEEAIKQIDTGLAEAELRLRFVNLPEDRQIRIRNIRSQHLGKMLVVDGFVKRASEIRPEICEIVYECLECGNTISMIQKERVLKAPERCEACGSKKFKPVKQKFYDARWIVVEEPYEITTGERPSELMIYLKEDLTSPKMQNKTEPGNRIKVVGILKELPRRVKGTRSKQMEIYLDANSVESVEVGWEEFEITPEDEKKILELAKDPEIYFKFIESIAPSMYGMEEVKEALLLQLVGGEPHVLEDGTRIRGNINILLVGDPASGKSQLMQFISKLIPRGRYVSGSGVTGVGLTATVTRDEEFLGGWVLEAGAIVMSNKSICAIDEFSKVSPGDRVALQEAMSLETISIAKASIVATLPAQTAILAGANPKLGRFDPYLPIREQVDIDDVLLSVDYNEPILVKENGTIKMEKIGSFVDRYCNGSNIVHLDGSIEVPALNLQTLKVEFWPVKYIFRHKIDEPLLKLVLETGREVKVTRGHSVYVFENCEIKPKKTSEIKVGDFVIIPKKLPKNIQQKKEINLVKELLKLPEDFTNTIYLHNIPKEVFSRLCVRNKSWKNNRRLPLRFAAELKEEEIKNCYLKYKGGTSSKIPTTVSINKELMRLLGYYVAEGSMFVTSSKEHLISFSLNGEERNIIDDLRKICKNLFNHEVTYVKDKRGIKVNIANKIVYLLFKQILKLKEGAENKEVPELVFNVSPELQREFLKAYHLGDYGITVSKKLASDLLYLFLQNNIIASISYNKPHESLFPDGHISRGKASYVVADAAKRFREFKGTKWHSWIPLEAIKDFLKLTFQSKYKGYGEKRKYRFLTKNWWEKVFLRKERIKLLERLSLLKDCYTVDEFTRKIYSKSKLKDFRTKREWTREYLNKLMEKGFVDRRKIKGVYKYFLSEKGKEILEKIETIKKIFSSDLGFAKVKEIKEELPTNEYVYDISVPGHENFVAGFGGVVCHNSRFDLKFALRDVPNPEIDAKMAEHILKVRHLKTEEAKPIIPPELLRKYIAYARSRIHPVLTKEAGELLMNFYLEMRKKSGEEAPIAITLRQYEALIRLAEASAKIQLRNFVTREDAERAIRLMKISLREFGFEPETGMFDIDRAEGQRVTAAQRSKIRIMIDILDELTTIHGKNIPQEEFLKRAREEGVEDAEEILRKMISEGIIFQPKPGFIQKV